ncbi:MAG: hypothetical protein O4751_11730 [Trichodesmium sp. St2_bin6]|nr:hypothetical protein [Trichodesmium sp. St2_bin6]MDE5102787.1 hypothetical protein [Trichodesmium sp. St19_bin2]
MKTHTRINNCCTDIGTRQKLLWINNRQKKLQDLPEGYSWVDDMLILRQRYTYDKECLVEEQYDLKVRHGFAFEGESDRVTYMSNV